MAGLWDNRNRKSTRVKDNKRRNTTAEYVNELKRKIGCQIPGCTEKDPRALTFHHINPAEKCFAISKAIKQRMGINATANEIAKCILICENHHRKIHKPLSPDEFPEEWMRPLGFLEERTSLDVFA